MPVVEITQPKATGHSDLVQSLASEWKHPNAGASEPIIALERGSDGKPLHVYVVWSRWSSVDPTHRSEIIMDAAEKVLPPAEVLGITIAMGVTPAEAPQLGLSVPLTA